MPVNLSINNQPIRPIKRKRSISPLIGAGIGLGGLFLGDRYLNSGRGLNAITGALQKVPSYFANKPPIVNDPPKPVNPPTIPASTPIAQQASVVPPDFRDQFLESRNNYRAQLGGENLDFSSLGNAAIAGGFTPLAFGELTRALDAGKGLTGIPALLNTPTANLNPQALLTRLGNSPVKSLATGTGKLALKSLLPAATAFTANDLVQDSNIFTTPLQKNLATAGAGLSALTPVGAVGSNALFLAKAYKDLVEHGIAGSNTGNKSNFLATDDLLNDGVANISDVVKWLKDRPAQGGDGIHNSLIGNTDAKDMFGEYLMNAKQNLSRPEFARLRQQLTDRLHNNY